MKSPHLLIVGLAAALCGALGCTANDNTDSDSTNSDSDSRSQNLHAITATSAVAGAPANHPVHGEVAPVSQYSAALEAPSIATVAGVQARANKLGARVGAVNGQLGSPSTLWARSQTRASDPAVATFQHVAVFAPLYSLDDAALASAEIERIHDTGRGAIVVNLVQKIGGVPVFGVGMSVVMTRDLELRQIGGSLHPAAHAGARLPALSMSDSAALAVATTDIAGGAVQILTERVRPVLYPHPKSLELAHLVEVEVAPANSSDSRAYIYVVADDGRILERINRTFSDAFRYRVWADTTAPFRPLDGPQGDWSPHPTGVPADLTPEFVAPSLVEVESFNTNPEGGTDPWLATGATLSSGNNVNAYADHVAPSGFGSGDIQADTTSAGTFDYQFDPTVGPFVSTGQVKAAVVQIFFTINWLHDFYYDSGFNEAARVAQDDNFGRGPGAGDALLAEAQDTRGEQRNNANMSTLGDGLSPRMQMYVWNGAVELIGETSLAITAPAGIAGDYPAQGSGFGVDAEVSASGGLALASPLTACAAVSGVSGSIAVIDRGDCTFVEKAQNAASAGATAVIIVNNQGTNALPPLGGTDPTISIPVVGISSANGQTIKNALGVGAVSGDTSRAGRLRGPDRDGTVDNAIVAHEWGHYFHHRLSFCGGTSQCGAMSEGWGDFMSVQLIAREGDDLSGAYGVPSFVSSDPYFGIRRVPYSTSFSLNALTFKHIGESAELPVDDHPMRAFGNNAEVHNAGEIWTTMLTEAYFALLQDSRLTFDQAQRRFSDYLVAGLLASPPNGTFTEVRDSILAVAAASDNDDMLVIAEAFARRGAGTGAVSPPRTSETLDGVVESFDIAGAIAVRALAVPGDIDCDEDENWDAGETALVRIDVGNAGPLGLMGTTVSVTSPNPEVSFPNGGEAMIASLDGFAGGVAEIEVTLSEDVADLEAIRFDVEVANSSAITPQVSATIDRRVNLDDLAASSANDDVESQLVVWAPVTDVNTFAWTRTPSGELLNTVWAATAPATNVDQRLESPILEVGDGTLQIEFDHRYRFEQSDGTNWDGAVIEVSTDGGSSWTDVGQSAGYTGILTDESGNPLGGRQAYTGESTGYPNMTTQSLGLGNQFAGQSIQIRFRLGTDGGVGDAGWEIDNLKVTGITNTPFATIAADEGNCDGIIEPGGDDDGGCGCQSSGSGTGGVLLLLLGLIGIGRVGRRRRRLAEG